VVVLLVQQKGDFNRAATPEPEPLSSQQLRRSSTERVYHLPNSLQQATNDGNDRQLSTMASKYDKALGTYWRWRGQRAKKEGWRGGNRCRQRQRRSGGKLSPAMRIDPKLLGALCMFVCLALAKHVFSSSFV
jgi:hypothetical protein